MYQALFMAGSTLLDAYSKKEAGEKNAAAGRRAAVSGRLTDRLRERGARFQQDSALSTIRANAGAAGVDLNAGSPLQAYLQTARETELEIIMAHKVADANFAARMSGAADKGAAGDSAAAGSLFSGAADIYKYRAKKNQATFKPSSTNDGDGGWP